MGPMCKVDLGEGRGKTASRCRYKRLTCNDLGVQPQRQTLSVVAVSAQRVVVVSQGKMVGCVLVEIVATSATDPSPDEPYPRIDEHGIFEAGSAASGRILVNHADGVVGWSGGFLGEVPPVLLFTDDRIGLVLVAAKAVAGFGIHVYMVGLIELGGQG